MLLALGPMHTIGLGSQAFGVVLMGMGVTALLTQLVVFKRLQPVIGLYKLGVVAATLFGTSAILFLMIGRTPCEALLGSAEEV